jgi:glycosyltransferase involved in cell wall biosynthesis
MTEGPVFSRAGGRQGHFLSWAPFSRRTETLAAEFGLGATFLVTPWPKRPWTVPFKYPWQALRTVRVLRGAAPMDELWIMDPPSPLVAIAGRWARRHAVPLVVDMHTAAFFAREWRLLRPVELPWLRAAAAVVVTNDELAAQVRAWGARAFVLPDPVPAPLDDDGERVDPGLVTVVATYSKDEPLEVLPAVAASLPGVRFAVTGAPRGDLSGWPANLTATGFLSDADYWRQLRRSAAVAVLTTRPATLLSGGYESMAVGRPLVVSDHEVLRRYFGDAAVYTGVDSGQMVEAVSGALARQEELAARIGALRRVREDEWKRAAGRLGALLGRPGDMARSTSVRGS